MVKFEGGAQPAPRPFSGLQMRRNRREEKCQDAEEGPREIAIRRAEDAADGGADVHAPSRIARVRRGGWDARAVDAARAGAHGAVRSALQARRGTKGRA